MNFFPRLYAILTLALLTGCSSMPSSKPTTVVCPTQPTIPAECPVCETSSQIETQCPEPRVIEKVIEVPAPLPPMATTAGKMHLPIIGAVEWVTIEPSDLRLQARMDTGIDTTTLRADKINLIEKDGKRYVHFFVTDPATSKEVEFERRLRRKVTVKQGDEERRYYVVKLWITLGQTRSQAEVALRSGGDPDYTLSVGRNFLVDAAIVDVSRQQLLEK